MAVEVGSAKKGVRPSMNVTPLVDVVLVLLIIFMVITPLLTKQFWLNVPKKDDAAKTEPPPDAPPPVMVLVTSSGAIKLGPEDVTEGNFPDKLRRVLAASRNNVMFFGAHPDVAFGRAMEVLDVARASGAVTIAVMTETPQGLH